MDEKGRKESGVLSGVKRGRQTSLLYTMYYTPKEEILNSKKPLGLEKRERGSGYRPRV